MLDGAVRMIENGHFRELQSIIDMLPVAGDSIGDSLKVQKIARHFLECKERKDRLLFFLQL